MEDRSLILHKSLIVDFYGFHVDKSPNLYKRL